MTSITSTTSTAAAATTPNVSAVTMDGNEEISTTQPSPGETSTVASLHLEGLV